MATVKKSKKKLIIAVIAVVLVIALIATSAVIISNDKGKQEITLASVATGSITQTVSSTGEVCSGAKKEYKPASVATVKEVFVKRGQEVKKGDVLATFDTAQLDEQVKSLQGTYDSAQKSYSDAVKAQTQAKKQLKAINKKIAQAEKATGMNNAPVAAGLDDISIPSISVPSSVSIPSMPSISVPSSSHESKSDESSSEETSTIAGGYSPDIEGAVAALADLVATINGLTESIEDTNAALQLVLSVIAEQMASGNYDSDKIAEAVGEAVSDAIKQGTIDFIDSGAAAKLIETAVRNIDYEALANNISENANLEQTSAEVQLIALYAQKEIYETAASGPTVAAQKQVMETAKSALETVKKSQESMSAGWVAAFDGIITACDIEPDTQTTLLKSGITLENDKSRVVTISLGEYDVHKVKVGMTATVTTAYGQYDGVVTDIAPTATGGSGGSILDSVGSMAGISGLSSLTDSGAGVECDILVNEPDENIIIGFNANVDIVTSEKVDVPTVPISSLVLEKDGAYVFVYNEEEGTATKTRIETGVTSDTSYEVLSGVSVGDKIIAAPGTYEEDTIRVKVVEK